MKDEVAREALLKLIKLLKAYIEDRAYQWPYQNLLVDELEKIEELLADE